MKLECTIEKRIGSFHLSVSLHTDDMVTALLGASGSGKSLTLKAIAGILTPDSGRIALDGRVLFDSSRHINLKPQERRVGYLFQDYALFPTMTVEKNILAGMTRRKGRDEKQRRLEELVSLLGLGEVLDHMPHQLSGGQAQRVALARMLASDPEFLLLDEPFSSLDTELRDRLQVELKALLEKVGKKAILVTHSHEEAYRLSSRLYVLEKGRILQEGKTEAVYRDPGIVAVARLFGYRNILRMEEAVSLGYSSFVRFSHLLVPEEAMKTPGTIAVEKVGELKELSGTIHILAKGDLRLWLKSPLQTVDSIDIDWSRCLPLEERP